MAMEKWRKELPHELYMRFDDRGEKPTLKEAIKEAEYVICMIQEGGCDYNEDEDGGKALLQECQRFIRRWKTKCKRGDKNGKSVVGV